MFIHARLLPPAVVGSLLFHIRQIAIMIIVQFNQTKIMKTMHSIFKIYFVRKIDFDLDFRNHSIPLFKYSHQNMLAVTHKGSEGIIFI